MMPPMSSAVLSMRDVMPANLLTYLSYGTGPHVDETRYSILSAVHRAGANPRFEIVVVTDEADAFANLGATILAVGAGQFRDWAGPSNFNHRIKILAMKRVMRDRNPKAVALVDGDTFYLRSPGRLFDRIGPGRGLMHVTEGRIGQLVALGHNRHGLSEMTHDLGTPGGPYDFDQTTPMWNAGVVGLSGDDAGLLDEVVKLTDAIHRTVPTHISEQLAFSRVLGRRIEMSDCRDVVFHYHQAFIRDRFRFKLPGLLRETEGMPPADRGRSLYAERPKPPFKKVMRAAIKRRLKPLGLFKNDLETSV